MLTMPDSSTAGSLKSTNLCRISTTEIFIVSAVYLLSFLFIEGFPHLVKGFPLDDSWIHQVVARNLARDGTLGFIPGVQSSGSSSLLWSLLLAANWKFFPWVTPEVYSGLLSVLSLIVTGCMLLSIARKDGLPATSCWIFALTPALNGNFMFLGGVGMEHILFVTLSVIAIRLWFEESLRSAIACSLCLGALSLTRPEGMILAFLIVLSYKLARRSRRDVLIVISTVSVCVMATFIVNFVTSHSWLPVTYSGRKFLYFGSENISLQSRMTFLLTIVKSMLHPWIKAHFTIPIILTPIVPILTAVGLVRLFIEHRLRLGFLCVWSFVLVGIYAVMLPSVSHAGRYQPLFLALNFPLLFLGAEFAISRVFGYFANSGKMKSLQTATILGTCILSGFYSLHLWREVVRDTTLVIESTHGKMGKLLVDSNPSQKNIAAFDIGRIGYLYGGRLIDLGGLTDSSFLPYLREHRIMDYLEDRKISYLVWPSNPDDSSGVRQIWIITPENRRGLTKIASFCAPEDEYALSLQATWNAARCQTLYQLNSQQ